MSLISCRSSQCLTGWWRVGRLEEMMSKSWIRWPTLVYLQKCQMWLCSFASVLVGPHCIVATNVCWHTPYWFSCKYIYRSKAAQEADLSKCLPHVGQRCSLCSFWWNVNSGGHAVLFLLRGAVETLTDQKRVLSSKTEMWPVELCFVFTVVIRAKLPLIV